MTLISGKRWARTDKMCCYDTLVLLANTHHPVKFHFQEPDKTSVLLTVNLMELQNAVNRVTREFEFLHRLLDSVVFGFALLI